MTVSTETILDLERRLRNLEDVHAITQIVTFVGPAADSGHAQEFAAVWEPDGAYNVGTRSFQGTDQIHDVIATGPHLTWMERGCAHLMSPPHIQVNGDRASATNYTTLAVHNSETGMFDARRVSANRWELRRVDGRWSVADRSISPLDGSPAGRDLLTKMFSASI